MIIPNPWLTNLLQGKTRQFVCDKTRINEIVHFRYPVFPEVTVDTQIVLLQKGAPTPNWNAQVSIVAALPPGRDPSISGDSAKIQHQQAKWQRLNGGTINIFLHPEEEALAAKLLKGGKVLADLCDINVGIKPYQTGKGTPPQTREIVEARPFDSSEAITELHRKYLRGSDIARYLIAPIESRYLKFGRWLAEPRGAANFDSPEKLFMRQTGDSLVAALDTKQHLCLNNMHVLVPKAQAPQASYLLGVINSQLLNWYYQTLNPEIGEALAEVKRTNVARLPIRTLDLTKPDEKKQYDRMVQLVEAMLSTQQQLTTAANENDRAYYQSKAAGLDRQIDELTCDLYGLTAAERTLIQAPGT